MDERIRDTIILTVDNWSRMDFVISIVIAVGARRGRVELIKRRQWKWIISIILTIGMYQMSISVAFRSEGILRQGR